MNHQPPLVLTILDGWGIAPPGPGNAASLAQTPNLDRWHKNYPPASLAASGVDVGLMPGQDGNSEAGHMNIGAGRIVPQDDVRVTTSIQNGTFFRNPAFLAAVHHVRSRRSTLHVMGMLGSHQSAHADPDHLVALLILAQNQGIQNIRVHLFTDGRDSPRFYAREMLEKLLPHLGDARIATITGRYYAMDRNKIWARTEATYRAITEGAGVHGVDDPLAAVTQAYNRGESDEFIRPTIIRPYAGVQDGDAMIYFNLRSDRARQLTKAFVQTDFEQKNAATKCFRRSRIVRHLTFVAMTDFGPDLGAILTAYPAESLTQTLPMALGDLRQLYIAESEKYAHITYFFNGGYAEPVANEERVMIPSPSVKYYDQTPGMSSQAITNAVVARLEAKNIDVAIVNYAATDMIAHTGNLQAGVKTMEIIDDCLGQLERAIRTVNGTLIITADHGNIEEMLNLDTKEIDTEHSGNPVPFYVVTPTQTSIPLCPDGKLCDVAPTILHLLGRRVPSEMTGQSLIQFPAA